jgi:hypothetical protein
VELEFIFGGVGEERERNIEKEGEGVGLVGTYLLNEAHRGFRFGIIL